MNELHAPPLAAPHAGDSPVRRSYLRFPPWSQPLWTLLTGKPLPNEKPPRPPWPVALRVAITFVGLAALVSLHLSLLCGDTAWQRSTGWLLTPVFALLVVGRLRVIQVVYAHHAVHGTLIKDRPRANAAAAALLTLSAVVQNESEYERDHLRHHQRNVFTTMDDADAYLLYRFGVRAGRTERELRRALWMTALSPVFHGLLLWGRVQSNLRRAWPLRCLCMAWIAWLFVVLPTLFGLVPVAVAVWLPLVVGYQVSALLQFATEHLWLQQDCGAACMTSYADRCHGRFCGEPLPAPRDGRESVRAWAAWSFRTLFIHLPTRVCVLTGDLPAHDWHHLCGMVGHRWSDWPLAIFERQRAIDSGHSAGMEHREIWGLHNMISHVLTSMSRAPSRPV